MSSWWESLPHYWEFQHHYWGSWHHNWRFWHHQWESWGSCQNHWGVCVQVLTQQVLLPQSCDDGCSGLSKTLKNIKFTVNFSVTKVELSHCLCAGHVEVSLYNVIHFMSYYEVITVSENVCLDRQTDRIDIQVGRQIGRQIQTDTHKRTILRD